VRLWSLLTGSSEIADQVANLASACAVRLADLIGDHHRYDDQFCAEVDRQLWALAEPVCSVARGAAVRRAQLMRSA